LRGDGPIKLSVGELFWISRTEDSMNMGGLKDGMGKICLKELKFCEEEESKGVSSKNMTSIDT